MIFVQRFETFKQFCESLYSYQGKHIETKFHVTEARKSAWPRTSIHSVKDRCTKEEKQTKYISVKILLWHSITYENNSSNHELPLPHINCIHKNPQRMQLCHGRC